MRIDVRLDLNHDKKTKKEHGSVKEGCRCKYLEINELDRRGGSCNLAPQEVLMPPKEQRDEEMPFRAVSLLGQSERTVLQHVCEWFDQLIIDVKETKSPGLPPPPRNTQFKCGCGHQHCVKHSHEPRHDRGRASNRQELNSAPK
jgi:hypothetical protein